MGINVLSLFDGMSCGQIALERLGIPIDNYYASEIDKYVIKVTQHNYPNTIQLGDVKNVKGEDLPKIDVLIGGSPCQGFSFAGKQLNFDDPRSKLFFEFVRILKECRPKYFLLENVKMKKEYQDVISEYLGVQPILINSALVSAQNRKRLYWTNIPDVTQPEDKNIYLKDIVEGECITEKSQTILSTIYKENAKSMIKRNKKGLLVVDRDKSHCIDANYYKGGNLKSYFEKHRRQLVFSKDELCHVGEADLKGHDSIKRVYQPEGKCSTLTSKQGGHKEPKILCGAWRGRYTVNGIRQDAKGSVANKTTQRMEVRQDGKTNTLTTVQKDNNVVDVSNLWWRKLTPLECERLQTVPDQFSSIVSNTQRYKMLGNGWTVDVIVHILKNMTFENN